MYKIIGSDQREYGPSTAEELRKWIVEGRANSQTKTQAEGNTEWKVLSDFAEFADALSANIPPPAPGSPPPIAFPAEATSLEYHIDIAKLFQRSWALMKDHFGLVVGATALVILIQIAINSIPHLGPIAGAVLLGPLWSGLYTLFLKLIRGQSAALSDAFAGFRADFVQLMLLGIVFQLLAALGLVLCLVPGIYVIVGWTFSWPLTIDKRLDFWPAMELSRKVVHKQWWEFFGFFIVCFLAFLVGLLACGLGVFITAPLTTGAIAYAYEDIFCRADRTPGSS